MEEEIIVVVTPRKIRQKLADIKGVLASKNTQLTIFGRKVLEDVVEPYLNKTGAIRFFFMLLPGVYKSRLDVLDDLLGAVQLSMNGGSDQSVRDQLVSSYKEMVRPKSLAAYIKELLFSFALDDIAIVLRGDGPDIELTEGCKGALRRLTVHQALVEQATPVAQQLIVVRLQKRVDLKDALIGELKATINMLASKIQKIENYVEALHKSIQSQADPTKKTEGFVSSLVLASVKLNAPAAVSEGDGVTSTASTSSETDSSSLVIKF